MWDGENFAQINDGELLSMTICDREVTKGTFELIEDQTIDIDSIEEKNISYVLCDSDMGTSEFITILNEFFRENNQYIDTILKAVKHLNKEIQSIKK